MRRLLLFFSKAGTLDTLLRVATVLEVNLAEVLEDALTEASMKKKG